MTPHGKRSTSPWLSWPQPNPVPAPSKTDRDFATKADQLIEREVKALLARLTPEVPFFGEEYGGADPAGTYWCLDPIDGTLNYYHGIPTHAVALAYVENGMPCQGEIALPALGERYLTNGEAAT